MCLAIPAQVLEFLEDNLVIADFGRGVRREVSVALVQEKLSLGDWILIHTGYAVSKMDPKEAKEILTLWEEIWRLEEESSYSSSSS
ncbi:MAG: HypC/HybG/HupF family hydrogenase formation chaperone [Candidatus Hodarchaeales archaeon]